LEEEGIRQDRGGNERSKRRKNCKKYIGEGKMEMGDR